MHVADKRTDKELGQLLSELKEVVAKGGSAGDSLDEWAQATIRDAHKVTGRGKTRLVCCLWLPLFSASGC
jgi:hypothetical protein